MKKTQRGFGLIETMLALAIFCVLTALVAQNLISIFQGTHEKNARAGVVDLMTAETVFKNSWGVWATDATTPQLSTCDGPKTMTAACLTSPALTNGSPYNGYVFTTTQPSDAGYLVIASPTSPQAGRLTYCGSSNDPLVHGIVSGSPVSVSSAAACSGFPAIEQGNGGATSDNTTYTRTGAGTSQYLETGTMTLLVPSGNYIVFAHAAVRVNNADRQLGYYSNANVACTLTGASLVDSGAENTPAATPPYAPDFVNQNIFLQGLIAGTTATMSCQNNAGQVSGVAQLPQGEAMNWNMILTATPVPAVNQNNQN